MSAALGGGFAFGQVLHADAPATEEPAVVDEVLAEVPEDERTADKKSRTDKTDKAETKEQKVVEIVQAQPKLWLGIQLKAIEGDLAAYLKNRDGVLVRAVVPDSPADKAGLEEGDILLRLGGRELQKPEDLYAVISKLKPDGEKTVVLDITLLRNGSERTMQITPEPKDASKGSDIRLEFKGFAPRESAGALLGDLVEGRLPHEMNEMRVFRFGFPAINQESRKLKGNLQINIRRDVEGKKTEVSIMRQENQPAKIKVTQDGKVSEYTEADVDNMPEEIKDIVKPLLDGRLQSRNSAWIDLTGDIDGKVELTLDHKELVEKVRNKAVEMAKQARDVAEDARQQAQAKADEYLKSANEYHKSAERSVRDFSTLPKQVEELRSLVDELREEVKKLRADVVGEAKASDKEGK